MNYDIYFSGSCTRKGSWGPTGVGLVCYKMPEKKELFTVSKAIGNGTRNTADYGALAHAMKEMQSRGYTDLPIRFLGDSELIIKQVNNLANCDAKHLQEFLGVVNALKQRFTNPIRVAFISLEENERADTLAKDAIHTKAKVLITKGID